MKDPSRLFRWMLLTASLVTIVFLLAAAVRENLLAQWYSLQRQYRTILASKADDDHGRELLRNYRVELKQVSVPALGAVDRCVSCHNGIDDPRMTDVPLPHRVHPGDSLTQHPLDRYGCTICHQGQGAATNFRDAKADDVYWDYPLLPPPLTQATCATCHDPAKLPTQSVALVLEGERLYQEKSCGSCHKLAGRGGTMGVALDDEGLKTRHQLVLANLEPPHTTWRWHEAHFRDPGALVRDSSMKNPTVTRHEALALTAFMLSRRRIDVPESYLAPDKIEEKARALHPRPLSGEEVYRRYCGACHGDGTYGRWDKTFKRFIPAVRGPSLQATATREYLEANIAKGRPGTQMPAWDVKAGGLQPEEIAAVVDYLHGSRPEVAPATVGPVAPPGIRGDLTNGAMLFGANCAGCHGAAGHGGVAPELANPTFQEAATDGFLATTIRHGRHGTAMPSFQPEGAAGLSDTDIADLVAFIRSLATPGAPGAAAGARADLSLSGGER